MFPFWCGGISNMDYYANMDNLIKRLEKKIDQPITTTETCELEDKNKKIKIKQKDNYLAHKNIYYSAGANGITSIVQIGIFIICLFLIICILSMFYFLITWFY